MVSWLFRWYGVNFYLIQVNSVLKLQITLPELQNTFHKLLLLSKRSLITVTLMHQMDLYTLTSKLTGKNSNTENLKELNKLKHNNNKQTKREKREIRKISLSGKLLNPMNPSGHLHGEKEDLDGISNVQLWLFPFWDKRWISIPEVLTLFSHIMKMSLHNLKLITMNHNGQIISSMLVIYTLQDWKCQNHLKISLQSNKCLNIVQQESLNFTSSCTDMTFSLIMIHKLHWRNQHKKILDTKISLVH